MREAAQLRDSGVLVDWQDWQASGAAQRSAVCFLLGAKTALTQKEIACPMIPLRKSQRNQGLI